jgi:D-proline reductase (dithiol) PrdA
VKIQIKEGRDIQLEIPVLIARDLSASLVPLAPLSDACPLPLPRQGKEESPQERPAHRLRRKHFKIEHVYLGAETKIDGATRFLRRSVCDEAVQENALVSTMTVDLITPDRYGEYSDTILDVQPIAVKEIGQVGEGVTRVLDGVVLVLTGTDDEGAQLGEFGSSAGAMNGTIMWGRPGAPDPGEMLIKVKVTIPSQMRMQRPGPLAMHKAVDRLTQEIREVLKTADEGLVAHTEELVHRRCPGQKKVALIKEIMGQGAMHDHLLLPVEPVGVLGAHANVDLGNVPLMMSPLQVLDGGIHAVTCVGPASKETSRQYWREPLVQELLTDPEVDFCGVIVVGSPQAQSEKMYVSQLPVIAVEALDLDGAILMTEGFGNNHIDFASHIEQIGKRGIPVVGVTYAAVQGQLVVGNDYMDALVELNKSSAGIENEILAHNCLTLEDAVRAVAMLKAKMAGEPIQVAEAGSSPEVKFRNLRKIEEVTGRKIALAPTETTLPPRTRPDR